MREGTPGTIRVNVPSQHTLPAVRLEESPGGQLSLTVAAHTVLVTPACTLRMDIRAFGWGPIISSEVVVSRVDASGGHTHLTTWVTHDVLDLYEIAPLVDALRQVSELVGCQLHIEEHALESG